MEQPKQVNVREKVLKRGIAEENRCAGTTKEVKDKEETSSNPDGEEGSSSKPQSAGANVRDAAQRILTLCQKAEWAPIDQILKSMEKAISNAGEDAHTTPLAGIADLVRSKNQRKILLIVA